jgi:hypothetical protein
MVGLRLLATADGENIMKQLADELKTSNLAMRVVFDEWEVDTKESLRDGARKLLPLANPESVLATQTVVDAIRDTVGASTLPILSLTRAACGPVCAVRVRRAAGGWLRETLPSHRS